MTEWISETPSIGLLRLLKEDCQYVVPPHQREYSWTADEIDKFFTDVEQAMSEGAEEYFLGLMVFKPDVRDKLVILDGQQRLATAIIVLTAIREWLRAHGRQEDANQIHDDYIAKRKLGGTHVPPKLVLNRLNNPSFVKYVIGEVPDQDIEADLENFKIHDPNRKLLEAILHCRKRIRDIASRAQQDQASKDLISLAGLP